MKKQQEKTINIKVYYDNISFVSDWALFLLSSLLLVMYWTTFLQHLKTISNVNTQLIGLMVLLYSMCKMLQFVRLPVRYTFDKTDLED